MLELARFIAFALHTGCTQGALPEVHIEANLQKVAPVPPTSLPTYLAAVLYSPSLQFYSHPHTRTTHWPLVPAGLSVVYNLVAAALISLKFPTS